MAAQMENPFANPFPGMNPYLESRRLWPEVHNNIIHEMFRFLRRNLPFRYTVIMDERVRHRQRSLSRDAPARYAEPDLSIRGGGVRERAVAAYQTEGRVTARLPLDDETSPGDVHHHRRTQPGRPGNHRGVAVSQQQAHGRTRAQPVPGQAPTGDFQPHASSGDRPRSPRPAHASGRL